METHLRHFKMHHSKKVALVLFEPTSTSDGFYLSVPNSGDYGIWVTKKDVPHIIKLLKKAAKK